MDWRAATHMTQLFRALVLASLLSSPGLAQPLSNAPDSFVKDDSDTPVSIGALLPFSGGVELYGEQAKLGIDLAAREINSKGGILGRPLQVNYADDGTRPAIALTGAHKLIEEDKVLAIIGPITSQNFERRGAYNAG